MELNGLKIAFLGDSITEGVGTTAPENIFHQIISRKYSLSAAYNCGIGGTRIAKQTDPLFHCCHRYDMYFSLRVETLPKDVDAIVVFGGTNDFGHGDSMIGDTDSDDIYTFCGALNRLITSLKTTFPNSKIIFMTPLRRKTEAVPNINGYILKDYVDSIIKVTQKYNIPVIDLFRSDILDPNDEQVLPDGLHPSDKGNAIMAEYIAKELQKF